MGECALWANLAHFILHESKFSWGDGVLQYKIGIQIGFFLNKILLKLCPEYGETDWKNEKKKHKKMNGTI